MHQGYEEEEVKDTTITRFKMRIHGTIRLHLITKSDFRVEILAEHLDEYHV